MEGTPYQLETHMAHTEDGFVLVLHRLVPRQASGAGGENGAGGNGNGKRASFGFGRSNSSSSNSVRFLSFVVVMMWGGVGWSSVICSWSGLHLNRPFI